jgi:hypothetical protein
VHLQERNSAFVVVAEWMLKDLPDALGFAAFLVQIEVEDKLQRIKSLPYSLLPTFIQSILFYDTYPWVQNLNYLPN